MYIPTKIIPVEPTTLILKARGPRRKAHDPRSPLSLEVCSLRIGSSYPLTLIRDMVAVAAEWTIFGFRAPTKLPPNETPTPTLNPLRVDRAPSFRGLACLPWFLKRFGGWAQ